MPQRSFIVEVSTVAGFAATGLGMGAILGGTIIGGTTGTTTMPDGESFIATDDFQIETDDQVVVLALPNGIPAVERLFH